MVWAVKVSKTESQNIVPMCNFGVRVRVCVYALGELYEFSKVLRFHYFN